MKKKPRVVDVFKRPLIRGFLPTPCFLDPLDDEVPTNIASVNLVISCKKFFFHYCNPCAGVLTLYK